MEDAIRIFDEVVAQFGDSPDPRVHTEVAGALGSKGVALGNLGRWEDAVEAGAALSGTRS